MPFALFKTRCQTVTLTRSTGTSKLVKLGNRILVFGFFLDERDSRISVVNGSGKFALATVRWGSPAPCVGAWSGAGGHPSAAVPMPRPTAPSAPLQTPTGWQFRGALGRGPCRGLLTHAVVWF